jgi:hypothetical protein
MKKFSVVLFLLLSNHFCFSQESPTFKKSNSKELSEILNNIRIYKAFSSEDRNVTILLTSGKPVEGGGTDEVKDNLYIGISEFDENPNQALFILEDIFGVKDLVISSNKSKEIILKFSYFDLKENKRKILSFKIIGLNITS